MGLRLKFNLVILAAFAVGFLIAAVVLNRVVNENARDQVLRNASIMMTGANAIRSYTSNELVPLLPTERNGRFVHANVRLNEPLGGTRTSSGLRLRTRHALRPGR